ncbi:DNA polymerase epsilon catalytic subunit A [Trema orientale]|uniref:DNA polymerase epsilon catalytic subunit A n=1 Tax=Trema orientale TaxID=63057 RepID=A0A2P5F6M0_TREOI|nr:DNA polymerase epsilon catalytic subunit A [Trema orientale]
MGSLMSGWDSPVFASKSGTYKRNRSLTKDEIAAYWKSKQKTVEEHVKDITSLSEGKQHQEIGKVEEDYAGKRRQRSSSLPPESIKEVLGDDESETSVEKLTMKNGWWTRSNWAFLNEPPVSEGASNSYVSQYHVASLAPSKSQPRDGIATI